MMIPIETIFAFLVSVCLGLVGVLYAQFKATVARIEGTLNDKISKSEVDLKSAVQRNEMRISHVESETARLPLAIEKLGSELRQLITDLGARVISQHPTRQELADSIDAKNKHLDRIESITTSVLAQLDENSKAMRDMVSSGKSRSRHT